MPSQLFSSYIRRSYQLLAGMRSVTPDGADSYERACTLIYVWTKKKYKGVFPEMPYYVETFEGKRNGHEVGVIYQPEEKGLILRATHPDNAVPGRIWIVDAQLKKGEKDYLLAVRVSVSSLQSCQEEVPVSRPQFVTRIAREIGLYEGYRFSEDPRLIETKEDVACFAEYLEDASRQTPVVLVTPCYSSEEGEYEGYALDAKRLAGELFGYAHVFRVTHEANIWLNDQLGQWGAYNGAIRSYYPNLSFEDSYFYQHPLITMRQIRMRCMDHGDDPNGCLEDIKSYIYSYTVRRQVQWGAQEMDFYLTAYQKNLLRQRLQNAQSHEETIELLNMEIEDLQNRLEESEQIGNAYALDCEKLQQEVEETRQSNAKLKVLLQNCRARLEAALGDTQREIIPERCEYIKIPAWVEEHFSDRMELVSRAVRSLRRACYSDVRLVYQCLELLATKYYDYRMGMATYDAFMVACKALDAGLEERGAVTEVTAGMMGETYFVEYGGRRRKLERHLTKGNDMDRRNCLRIYFFWDRDEHKVIIGDLPHHLDNRMT